MNIVVAYPAVDQPDYDWIQGIRENKDELYFDVVEPHFTLVFPGHSVENAVLKEHVRDVVLQQKPIEFVLRSLLVVKDSFNEYWHTFLVPDEGNSEIIKLHDRLYTGPLVDDLLLEIPFIPHIGIGSNKDKVKAKQLADELNANNIQIQGSIDTIALIDAESIETIEKIELEP